MGGDTFGKQFQVTTWGGSHGSGIGGIISGCPAGIKINLSKDIMYEMNRRKPGQSKITTDRKEDDQVTFISGVRKISKNIFKTDGTALHILIGNTDAHSEDYKKVESVPRPSHADFAYEGKYGLRDPAGGGRSSARLTAPMVAAGAIAKKWLHANFGTDILGYTAQIGFITDETSIYDVTRESVEGNIVRMPNSDVANNAIAYISSLKARGNSTGGIVQCIIRNPPQFIGEPLFNKMEGALAQAMLNINAVKGFELGDGFAGVDSTGKARNDPYVLQNGAVKTETNNDGGIQGGITTGMPIEFRVAFKPTATIMTDQRTVNLTTKSETVLQKLRGRHDPCVVPRAVPIVEAYAAVTLMDHALQFYGYRNISKRKK